MEAVAIMLAVNLKQVLLIAYKGGVYLVCRSETRGA